MGKNNRNNSYTFIGSGSIFEGSITVPHEIRISGEFKGSIKCSDTLIVGKEGVVKAEIEAQNTIVSGTIEGNLTCGGRVELEDGASVIGDITASELIINQGAEFQGRSAKTSKNSSKKVSPTPEKGLDIEL